MNDCWVVPGQDRPEFTPVSLRAEGLEDLVEEGFSFPRTPNLSLLRSCCSNAADRYLLLYGASNSAVLLLSLNPRGAAARP